MRARTVPLLKVIPIQYSASHAVPSGTTTRCHSLESPRNHTIHRNIKNQDYESYLLKESRRIVRE